MTLPTTPFGVAALRGLLTALVTFGSTTLATVLAMPADARDWETALISGGAAALAVVGARIGVEGSIDTRRDTPPVEVQPGDVGRRP